MVLILFYDNMQARRNEKIWGVDRGIPITKYIRPPWLADEEIFINFKSS